MGGTSAPSTSGAENVEHIPQQAVDSQGGHIPGIRQGAFEQGVPSQQQNHFPSTQHVFSSQFDMRSTRPDPYSMAPFVGTLPPVNFRHGQYQGGQQRYNHTSPPPMMPQMAPMPRYPAPSPPIHLANQGYYVPQPHMPSYYTPGQLSPSQMQTTMPPGHNIAYYPSPAAMNPPQTAYYYPHATQYPGHPQSMQANMVTGQYNAGNIPPSDPPAAVRSPVVCSIPSEPKRNTYDEDKRKGTVRGPPRKPRQSGNAVWIGNLPPQTDLMKLVNHVCKETTGLVSLFLISKSNCAFANFQDETSSVAGQQKLHESKFESVRLVSRLRKSTVEGATRLSAPTGPAASTPESSGSNNQPQGSDTTEASHASPTSRNSTSNTSWDETSKKDRFFILKSLTVEDLELSVRTGIWATQSHNEEAINNAFKTCDNVYLIFSANKSGEYFGYARMTSEINDDPKAAVKLTPASQATNDIDLPKATLIDATEYAPKGKIVDDSPRGTIFWEIERGDSESGSEDEDDSNADAPAEDEETRALGKPFNLEWLSTSRLPFYRTRGLRNPWNSNREVKIARDGTELEPSVGRRLVGLFSRVQGSRPLAAMRPPVATMPKFQRRDLTGNRGMSGNSVHGGWIE